MHDNHFTHNMLNTISEDASRKAVKYIEERPGYIPALMLFACGTQLSIFFTSASLIIAGLLCEKLSLLWEIAAAVLILSFSNCIVSFVAPMIATIISGLINVGVLILMGFSYYFWSSGNYPSDSSAIFFKCGAISSFFMWVSALPTAFLIGNLYYQGAKDSDETEPLNKVERGN